MRRLSLIPALALGVLTLSTPRLPAPPLPPATGSSGGAFEKHLLDDTDLLVVVNVKEALKSPFFTKHVKADVEKLLGRPEVKPYLQEAGIDLLTDVDQVVVCMGKSCHRDKPGPDSEDGPVILLQGKFDKDKIDKQLARLAQDGKGVKAVEHDKARFHRIGFGPGDNGPYVAALDKSTLLVCGSKAQVVEQMSRVAGKSRPKLKFPAIAAFLKARAKAPATIDAIALDSMITGTAHTARKNANGGAVVEEIRHTTLGDEGFKQFTVHVKIKDDARGTLRMEVKKAGDLENKVKAGQKIVGEMKQSLNNLPPGAGIGADQLAKMREFVNGIKVRGDKDAVIYEATGTGEQFATLVKMYLGLIERF